MGYLLQLKWELGQIHSPATVGRVASNSDHVFFALHSSMREEKEEFQDTKYSVWLLPEAIDTTSE